MSLQRTRPLKVESLAEGGGQSDDCITEVNIGADYLDALGFCLQLTGATASTSDGLVNLSRASDSSLQFQDVPCGAINLGQLLTSLLGKPGTHAAVADFSHWVGAPAEGYVSGVFRQATFSGVLAQTITWFTSNAATTKLFQTAVTYSGVLVSQKVHTLYSGGVVIRTLTEQFNYSGSLFCPSVTRTWS